MKILHVASEVAPLIKTGGLADVVGSLPAEQVILGHDVSVLVPGYPAVLDKAGPLERLPGLVFPGFGGAGLLRGKLAGDVELLVVEHNDYFARQGNPYTADDGYDWPDNHQRFALFGRVAATLARATPAIDMLHLHDWHAGLTLAYLKAWGGGPASCFTIHNLAFQGEYPRHLYGDTGLPDEFYRFDGLEFHSNWSFMKAGLSYSDAITTVSPTYAKEILTVEAGMGFHGLLDHRREDLHGILNGVDYSLWSPAIDTEIPFNYDVDSLAKKALNKSALQEEFELAADPALPLVGVVSRLTRQKGLDFSLKALRKMLALGKLQLVLIGTGDSDLESGFVELSKRYPDNCAVTIGYDENLAHRVFGGADANMIPSLFEPCGLTQLYGLRYGTLPVVRTTGGLADTVRGFSGRNMDDATGFRFDAPSALACERVLGRMCKAFSSRALWQQLMANAMNHDFSWSCSAQRYIELYQSVIARRSHQNN
jgi:starch synthase